MEPNYLIVISELDPVARRVAEAWGSLPPAEGHVEGAPLRRLSPTAWTVRRPVRHVHDDHLDRLLPAQLRARRTPLVFPSIHRSERGPVTFTVHPLGNLGDEASFGGLARHPVPPAPRLMASALRALAEGASALGVAVSYEATHHGPSVALPAFFVEVGGGVDPEHPAPEQVFLLAKLLGRLEEDGRDRIALGVGGGHYAPHFTELALERCWAFGHLISRHALSGLEGEVMQQAWESTPGAEGIVYARARDADHPALRGIGPRLRDSDAPRRGDSPLG